VLVQPPTGSDPVLVGERRAQELERRGYTILGTQQAEQAPSYTNMKKAELVEEAELRGLDAEGTVAELVARLEADDKA
jgi:hypothetical protein